MLEGLGKERLREKVLKRCALRLSAVSYEFSRRAVSLKIGLGGLADSLA
jgi:hypothetical protein